MLAQQYNPRVIEALCTTADLARDDETLLQDAAADIARTALQPCNGTLHIPVKLLEDHPALAGRIVRRCVELLNGSCRGLTSLHTEAVLKLLKCTGSNKQIPLTGGLVARREYDTLFMGPASLQADFHIQVDTLPADVPLPQAGLRILLRSVALKDDSMLRPDANSDTVHLNPDSIALPLIIRTWRPGDRMQPFGFDTVKKVKAVFADNKVPVRLRGLMPLIESDGRIISVGTLRIAEHCRVNPSCPEVIELTVTSIDRQ
jgi:tRNA(Ile)-lysidine synthase